MLLQHFAGAMPQSDGLLKNARVPSVFVDLTKHAQLADTTYARLLRAAVAVAYLRKDAEGHARLGAGTCPNISTCCNTNTSSRECKGRGGTSVGNSLVAVPQARASQVFTRCGPTLHLHIGVSLFDKLRKELP